MATSWQWGAGPPQTPPAPQSRCSSGCRSGMWAKLTCRRRWPPWSWAFCRTSACSWSSSAARTRSVRPSCTPPGLLGPPSPRRWVGTLYCGPYDRNMGIKATTCGLTESLKEFSDQSSLPGRPCDRGERSAAVFSGQNRPGGLRSGVWRSEPNSPCLCSPLWCNDLCCDCVKGSVYFRVFLSCSNEQHESVSLPVSLPVHWLLLKM